MRVPLAAARGAAKRAPRWAWSAAHQGTGAFLQRTERLGRRNGGAQLVEVTGIFRFLGLLDFEQIRVVDLASIGADRALAEQWIVGRRFLIFATTALPSAALLSATTAFR